MCHYTIRPDKLQSKEGIRPRKGKIKVMYPQLSVNVFYHFISLQEERMVLKKTAGFYNKLEEVVLVVMLSGSLIVLFINVILRYIFNSSIYGADELARILFVWMSWLGISIGERRSEHIRIDMLVNRFKGVPGKMVELIANLVTFSILAVLVYEGLNVVAIYFQKGVTTPMYNIPQWLIYFSVPYSCAVMAIRLFFNSITLLHRKNDENITEGGGES